MLKELRIENLLLIERAELQIGDGLNVITGETGAGKTMLAHAIDLLLGGRSRRGIVRPGAAEAYVEGLFELPPGLLEEAEFAEIAERLADPGCEEIALGRRVNAEGRTRAYIEGRSATAADLKLLGGALVAFYGQHEHRKLTLAGAQLAALDSFATEAVDGKHQERLDAVSELHTAARELSESLTELELVEGRRERELGLIEFELAEIEELAPDPAEEEAFCYERDRLRAVDRLRAAAHTGLAALDGEDAEMPVAGAAPLLATATAALRECAGADARLDELAQRSDALAIELGDIAAELRTYAGALAADPERLAFLESRLGEYERIKHKHGGSLMDVLEHADRCREDRDRLAGAGEAIEQITARLAEVRERGQATAAEISRSRRKAAPKLAARVRERLAKLALEGASFEVSIESHDESRYGDFRPTGCDEVEFLIAPNPGIAPAPLREIASGGELSRVMLALLTSGGESSRIGNRPQGPTLVFDEVDAGIGGRTARAVGEHLRELGRSRQVICITHLPQVAAAANSHFRIVKDESASETTTHAHRLAGPEVVEELCRMLGADSEDSGARRHAEELLAAN